MVRNLLVDAQLRAFIILYFVVGNYILFEIKPRKRKYFAILNLNRQSHDRSRITTSAPGSGTCGGRTSKRIERSVGSSCKSCSGSWTGGGPCAASTSTSWSGPRYTAKKSRISTSFSQCQNYYEHESCCYSTIAEVSKVV